MIQLVGKIDQSNVNPFGEFESEQIVFDCFVRTGHVDEAIEPPPRLSEEDAEALYPVMIFSTSRERLTRIQKLDFVPASGDWYEITLSSQGGEIEVTLGGQNDELGETRFFLTRLVRLGNSLTSRLNTLLACFFNESGDAEEIIKGKLKKVTSASTPFQVSVVDVGQGSLAALHKTGSEPRLFFDLGWPTVFNFRSAPLAKPQLTGSKSPVVLSHWDWDHWGLAIEKAGWSKKDSCWKISWNAAALNRPWIVPGVGPNWGKVSLSPIHWRLALALTRSKNFYRWPHALPELRWSTLTICRAAGGKPNDRNQHGLVMVVHQRIDVVDTKPVRAILLPGDADYKNIPFLDPKSKSNFLFSGLAATHHGGRFTRSVTPMPTEHALIAYSVGHDNTYGHPKKLAQMQYIKKGWHYQALTAQRAKLSVASPDISPDGSVLLTTSNLRTLPAIAAGVWWLGKQ